MCFSSALNRLWSALACLLLSVAACGAGSGTQPSSPTEGAALAYLDEVVAIVRSGDISTLCTLGSGTCQQMLRGADPAAVPVSDPIVIGTRVMVPSQTTDGASLAGGRILELCGRDGLDQPYYSEMLVFEAGGRLISTGTAYWLGYRIASSSTVGGSPPPSPCPREGPG